MLVGVKYLKSLVEDSLNVKLKNLVDEPVLKCVVQNTGS